LTPIQLFVESRISEINKSQRHVDLHSCAKYSMLGGEKSPVRPCWHTRLYCGTVSTQEPPVFGIGGRRTTSALAVLMALPFFYATISVEEHMRCTNIKLRDCVTRSPAHRVLSRCYLSIIWRPTLLHLQHACNQNVHTLLISQNDARKHTHSRDNYL
jgi:hypothetical protein